MAFGVVQRSRAQICTSFAKVRPKPLLLCFSACLRWRSSIRSRSFASNWLAAGVCHEEKSPSEVVGTDFGRAEYSARNAVAHSLQ
jgi:hypothetical protein